MKKRATKFVRQKLSAIPSTIYFGESVLVKRRISSLPESALYKLGRRREAMQYFKKALTIHPGDWDIRRCIKAFGREPRTAADYRFRAEIYHKYLDIQTEALKDALAALKLSPNNAENYGLLSEIYEKLGEDDKAQEAEKKAEQIQKIKH